MTAPQSAWQTQRYRVCGLNIASCVELPGAAAADPSPDSPDIVLRFGAVPEHLPQATVRGPNWEVAPGEVLLRLPMLARFLMKGGREVRLDPLPGRGPEDFAVFIMGPVMGALLHQRGLTVLHASAVDVDSEVVLFCGPSASGKSVLVAALASAGYPLVSDDLCLIGDEHGRPTVIPDGRRLKLWGDAIRELSLGESKRAAVRAGIEKYWVDPPAQSFKSQLPLRSIYFLRPAWLPGTTGIAPLPMLDTMALVRANAYRRRLIRALGLEQPWLERCASIARVVRGWEFTSRLEYRALPESVSTLQQHWRR